MGNEKTQPTLIDKDEYEKFKQFVADAHGHTHGHLKTEIENALREYRQSTGREKQLTRMENDIATMKKVLAEGNSDGGEDTLTLSHEDNTHTRESDKPASNQPRDKKVAYLITQLIDEFSVTRESGEIPKQQIKDTIKKHYNFRDDIAESYYDDIVTDLKAEEHPMHGKTVAWGERYSDIVDDLRDKADEEMTDL
jgi:hypothetical protein